ncbi:hypothetical protein GWK36_05320 [Caldichromatium japonicum]|uniref:Uncharacterized protein n=1 Tax=Caldichromatium japonicum TaxID=2699430 RepID=A0A6G7VC02_9GAMM|nr:hypothetical protein [Caldichromatium japonicum]QIK37494.1 hypothetical protein GWK36_05320 [Caldichromatium japonicum]
MSDQPRERAVIGASSGQTPAGLAVVSVLAEDLQLAFESAKIGALYAAGATLAPSLVEFLGWNDSQGTGNWRLLEIIHPERRRLIRVREPVRHLWLPAASIRPVPPLLAACQRALGRTPQVRAFAWLDGTDGGLVIILDAWQLPELPPCSSSSVPPCVRPSV